ncbi:hypothetical protein HID58_005666, partial [Brassica napus]
GFIYNFPCANPNSFTFGTLDNRVTLANLPALSDERKQSRMTESVRETRAEHSANELHASKGAATCFTERKSSPERPFEDHRNTPEQDNKKEETVETTLVNKQAHKPREKTTGETPEEKPPSTSTDDAKRSQEPADQHRRRWHGLRSQKPTTPISQTGYSLTAINGPRPKPIKPNRRRLDQTRRGDWLLKTWKHLRHRIDTRRTPSQPDRLRLETPSEPSNRASFRRISYPATKHLPSRWSSTESVIGQTALSSGPPTLLTPQSQLTSRVGGLIDGELHLLLRSHPHYLVSTRADKNKTLTELSPLTPKFPTGSKPAAWSYCNLHPPETRRRRRS